MANKRKITGKSVAHQVKGGVSRKHEISPPTPDQVGASLRIVDSLINMGMQIPQIPSNHIETLQRARVDKIIPTGYESFDDFMQKIKALGILAVISSDE
mgnify:FL=1